MWLVSSEEEEIRKQTHKGETIWKRQKKKAIVYQLREALEETKPADTLISDFQPRELWEINFYCKPPSLWYFVTALAH